MKLGIVVKTISIAMAASVSSANAQSLRGIIKDGVDDDNKASATGEHRSLNGGLDNHTTTNIDTVTGDVNGNNAAVVEMRNDDNYGDDIIHRRLSLDDNSFLFDAGEWHTCAVSSLDDKLYCWGYNGYGILGDGTTTFTDKNIPTLVSNIGNVEQLSLGGYHTCAVLDDGTLYCWGDNSYGQLGDGTTIDKNEPTLVTINGVIKQVSVGGHHTCALLDDGTLYCWGYNGYGQLGDNTTINSNTPTLVSNIGTIKQISLGGYHTCALLDDDALYCWGRNDHGQLGLGDSGDGTTERNTPTEVSNIGNIKQVSLGWKHTCALLDDGTLYCWGRNHYGQLGDATTINKNEPTLVSNIGAITQVSLGRAHTCALLDDGTLHCWGYNKFGQLGDDTAINKNEPTPVSNIGAITQVSLGGHHTCALLVNSTLYCWGRNGCGELGNGNNDNVKSAASSTGALSV